MKDKKTVNLVLEGGGVKGIGLVGAIECLEEEGYSWNYIGGTSAGAIVATLLAVGYTGRELYEFITGSKIDFVDIMDNESVKKDFLKTEKLLLQAIEKRHFWTILFALLRRFFQLVRLWRRLWKNHGLFDGVYVENTVRKLIENKTGKSHYTFADLAEKTDHDANKLSLMVTDITNGRLLILPRDLGELQRTPEDTELVDAMRMSMSFPLFFKPVKVLLSKSDSVLLMDGGY